MKRAPPAPRCRPAAIYVLDGFFQNCGDAFAKIDARPVIGDLNELAEWDVFCRRSGWAGGAAIHIDTGMNRLGLTLVEAQGIIPRINAGDHGITLVMSHLACAEHLNHPLNAKQLATFREIASLFSGVPASLSNSSGCFLGAAIPVRSGAAGSCALRRQSDAGSRQSDAAGGRTEGPHRADPQCREGRNRRLWRHLDRAAADPARDRLRPAMPTDISAPPAPMTAPAAPRSMVAGKRCPVAGRISMDLMAIDITDLEKNAARRGHMVTLIGEGITVDELAHHFGTIGYEVLTSLGPRYARIYKGGAATANGATPRTAPARDVTGLTACQAMKIATFNINNINRRLPNLLRMAASRPSPTSLRCRN